MQLRFAGFLDSKETATLVNFIVNFNSMNRLLQLIFERKSPLILLQKFSKSVPKFYFGKYLLIQLKSTKYNIHIVYLSVLREQKLIAVF